MNTVSKRVVLKKKQRVKAKKERRKQKKNERKHQNSDHRNPDQDKILKKNTKKHVVMLHHLHLYHV
jgi:hypothetical protein